MKENKQSLRSRVKDMQPGESIVVSLDDYSPVTIYNYASGIGFAMNRTYVTSRDRQARTIEIRRES